MSHRVLAPPGKTPRLPVTRPLFYPQITAGKACQNPASSFHGLENIRPGTKYGPDAACSLFLVTTNESSVPNDHCSHSRGTATCNGAQWQSQSRASMSSLQCQTVPLVNVYACA
jgi:hypothetical protein